MSKLLWVFIGLVLVALGVGGFLVLSDSDDDASTDVAASESSAGSTTEPAEATTTSSAVSAKDGFCLKFYELSSAQRAASSRMMSIFKDLSEDGTNPDPALIAVDLRKFVARIKAAAELRAEAPAEIAADYVVVEAGLTGATVPYEKLAAAADQSVAAARAYVDDEFMDDIGDLATDAYMASGERVQDWVDTNCRR